jgi:hypothetical protein
MLKKSASFALISLSLFSQPGICTQPIWQSGFETGYPSSEWLDFDSGTYSPVTSVASNQESSAWTIIDRKSGEPVYTGNFAYKGWISRTSHTNHRAYPVIHTNMRTPLINTFMVYLDVDYVDMTPSDWIHLGTWGNHDPKTKAGLWALHTVSIRNRKLEFAHTSPFHGEYIGSTTQPDFPLRKWVRLTVYMHYNKNTGIVQVWQDGIPMLRANISQLEHHPGEHLRTAHWGMYASGSISHGKQYNDDIRICLLKKPLTSLIEEPLCNFDNNKQLSPSGM